jgi:hypothetical protein
MGTSYSRYVFTLSAQLFPFRSSVFGNSPSGATAPVCPLSSVPLILLKSNVPVA